MKKKKGKAAVITTLSERPQAVALIKRISNENNVDEVEICKRNKRPPTVAQINQYNLIIYK